MELYIMTDTQAPTRTPPPPGIPTHTRTRKPNATTPRLDPPKRPISLGRVKPDIMAFSMDVLGSKIQVRETRVKGRVS